jgi:hypothetical protein
MPSNTLSTQALHEKAKRGILAGELPSAYTSLWGGRGDGKPCALCGLPITLGQALMELRLKDRGGPVFHTACHQVWRSACEEMDQLAEPG